MTSRRALTALALIAVGIALAIGVAVAYLDDSR